MQSFIVDDETIPRDSLTDVPDGIHTVIIKTINNVNMIILYGIVYHAIKHPETIISAAMGAMFAAIFLASVGE